MRSPERIRAHATNLYHLQRAVSPLGRGLKRMTAYKPHASYKRKASVTRQSSEASGETHPAPVAGAAW